MINFVEHQSKNYQGRTKDNVKFSDVTIAFAIDFSSSGEITTKKAAIEYKKPFIPVLLSKEHYTDTLENSIYFLKTLQIKGSLDINIAGNGISRLIKHNITQEMCDNFVYNFLKSLIDNGIQINSIRSGGQTGADESGLKAAIKLGIPSECLCPKGYRYRDETQDISNEILFKQRFYGNQT